MSASAIPTTPPCQSPAACPATIDPKQRPPPSSTRSSNTIRTGINTTSTLCLFGSKHCTNPRAVQPNGMAHKYCEFHRRQAQLPQRTASFHRKQAKILFRDPSRIPAAMLKSAIPSMASMPPSLPSLPRLRSHDVLRRALLMTAEETNRHARPTATTHMNSINTTTRGNLLPRISTLYHTTTTGSSNTNHQRHATEAAYSPVASPVSTTTTTTARNAHGDHALTLLYLFHQDSSVLHR